MLFTFGIVVIFVADHFVRPLLIGSAVRLSFLWVLLGILGGLESFGFLGLILGPTIMAAFATSWREWRTCEAIDARADSREETAEGSANCANREIR
jgi:predicted PurR-regulated permease PerM